MRSSLTWDTTVGHDLRRGEEAIIVSAEEFIARGGLHTCSRWTLISIDKPRLIQLTAQWSIETVLKRWLKPADLM